MSVAPAPTAVDAAPALAPPTNPGPQNPPSGGGVVNPLSATLGSGAPKCKICGKTAYQLESITYDQATYHKRCFRCTKCESVVNLSKVAMIQGDLYCKTCFVKMFKIKGTYHVFGSKTLPSIMKDESKGHGRSQSSLSAEMDGPKSPPSIATHTVIASAVSPASKQKMCAVDDCHKSRAAGKSWCTEHIQTQESFAVAPGVEALHNAITSKNVIGVTAALEEHGVNIALELFNKKSSIELVFGDNGSPACGDVILEAISNRLRELEGQVASLKAQTAQAPGS